MKNFREVFNFFLIIWLLAIGIDGFWGGVTAGQVGSSISLAGAMISFLLLIVSYCRRPPKNKPRVSRLEGRYDRLATKTDLADVRAELMSLTGELRGMK